jgi:hypothetical protein
VKTLDRRAWKVHHRKPRAAKTATQPVIEQLAEVVYELRDLLHDYAPSWYSSEHHGRVESAIQRLAHR